MDTLAARLRQATDARKMTPTAAAKAAGISRAAIYFILDGTTKPENVRESTISGLCKALGVRREWLVDGRGEMADAALEEVSSTALSTTAAQPVRLDPEMIADTTEVLEVILGRRGGRTLDLKKPSHAALFAEAYVLRALLDDAPAPEFTASVIDLVAAMEERDRGERTRQQDSGDDRGTTRRAGAA